MLVVTAGGNIESVTADGEPAAPESRQRSGPRTRWCAEEKGIRAIMKIGCQEDELQTFQR
jgi:hypothetical protein